MEAGGSHGHMSPEEHYRRMMSALSEQGSYEEQQQRLYQLASSMGLQGHGESIIILTVIVLALKYLHCTQIFHVTPQLIFTFRIRFPTLALRIDS